MKFPAAALALLPLALAGCGDVTPGGNKTEIASPMRTAID
jgi:hypothetical protein